MSPSNRVPGIRLAVIAGVLLAEVWGSSAPEAQTPFHGATTVTAPERTDAGTWTGTWYYVSRTHRMALWIREDGEQLQIQAQLQGAKSGTIEESFVTDWNGVAEYGTRGQPGKFALRITEHDKNTIRGTWSWEYGRGNEGFAENADISAYRAGAGRLLVWKMDNVRRERGGDPSKARAIDQVVWVFDKVSQRPSVLWNELPF